MRRWRKGKKMNMGRMEEEDDVYSPPKRNERKIDGKKIGQKGIEQKRNRSEEDEDIGRGKEG